MEHFQRFHVFAAAGAQRIEAVEEVLAGELVAEQGQLQRLQFPCVADGEVRAQDDLVDRGAEGVFGGVDIVGGSVLLARVAPKSSRKRVMRDWNSAWSCGALPFFSMNRA